MECTRAGLRTASAGRDGDVLVCASRKVYKRQKKKRLASWPREQWGWTASGVAECGTRPPLSRNPLGRGYSVGQAAWRMEWMSKNRPGTGESYEAGTLPPPLMLLCIHDPSLSSPARYVASPARPPWPCCPWRTGLQPRRWVHTGHWTTPARQCQYRMGYYLRWCQSSRR